jgi:NAD+ synthase (glutamine-hydrolysing)
MKIAIAQLNPTIGALEQNATAILAAAQTVSGQGAQLLLCPELALCGYPPRDLLMLPDFIERIQQVLQKLANDLPQDLPVLVGCVAPNPKALDLGGKPLFNSVALLHQGLVQRHFHKRLLPTYDVFDENRYFEPGQSANWFEWQGVRLGVTICEDLWNDEEFWGQRNYQINPIAELAQVDVDLTLNLSASPFTLGKQALREALLAHTARRFDQPMLYVNQVGGNDDLIFDGGSVGFSRSGDLVMRAQSFATDLAWVEYDPEVQDLRPIAPPTAAADCAEAELWRALVLGVRDYGRKCGFSRAVLGLSGGIDSALVAAIAAAALGPENVLGLLMPSPYSSDHSIHDAKALAQNLGIQTQTIAIKDLMQGFDQALAPLFAGTEFGIAEENIQSRIRGNLLMAVANKFGYLLLSTGNKSELAVGYCTLYGDMNGGLAAIADVPKTRVFSLCHWLNQVGTAQLGLGTIIPPNVLTKPPSAELKPGQLDQDSLPPYDVLDEVLDRLICRCQSPQQILAAGHSPDVVNQVLRLLHRAEFKRRQAAPVLKVTDRAFGVGWRMPIASQGWPRV